MLYRLFTSNFPYHKDKETGELVFDDIKGTLEDCEASPVFKDFLTKCLIEDYDKRNDIHILALENVATSIKLYGKDIRTIMKNIHYGLMFQTKNEKNMKYTQKLLSDSNISDLMEQILINPNYCVLYRNQIKTSVEQTLSDEEDSSEDTSNTTSTDSASEALKKLMDSIDTKEDLIAQLQKDINAETDSIKRQHFVNLYNNFVE